MHIEAEQAGTGPTDDDRCSSRLRSPAVPRGAVAVVDREPARVRGAPTRHVSPTGHLHDRSPQHHREGGTPMAGQDWFEKDFYAVLGVPKDADAADDQEGLPQARAQAPPRRQPG